jgi:HTH-type transcriptional regulator, bacterioopsin transcriptional activator and related proteins
MRINDAGLHEALDDLRSLATSPGTQWNYLELSLQIICLGLEVPLGKVLELDSEGKSLLIRAGVGWREGIIGHVAVPANKRSIAGYTLEQTGVVIFEDVMETSRFSGAHLLFSQDIRSTMAIRILCRGKPWGVLTIHEQIHRRFTSQEIEFLQDAARDLGALIEAKEAVRTS